jgi:outer membrane protein OmpA-like peptidoglycan-associated protein
MRLLKQVFYSSSLLVAMAMMNSGCSVKTNMGNNNYTVTPNPLELKGDSVTITMSATIPAKSFNPKANVQFQPVLKTAKGDVTLKAITLGGEKVTESVDFKIDSKTGGRITYTEKIPYNSDLKRATLYPTFAVKIKGNYQALEELKGVKFSDKVLAEGTITTVLMAKATEQPIFDITDYTATYSNKSVNIYFPLDVDKFNPKYKAGKGLDNAKQLKALKDSVKSDKNWVVKGLAINGFASPEGELSRNDGLSKGRATSTFSYLKKELKKLGFTEVNDSNLSMGATLAEDWNGLAKLVSESKLAGKADIVNIITNNNIADLEKESLIRRDHAKAWETIKKELLPKLRRAELMVKGQSPLKSDNQLLATTDLETLTDVELLHLAAIGDNNKKMEVYTKYAAKYPNDWKGANGLGALYLLNGDYANAEAQLNQANQLSPENPTVLANLAATVRANGNTKRAEELIKQAEAKGADMSYQRGMIALKKGDYAGAVSNFNKSGRKDFNFALAQVLNGNATGAKAIIDNMKPEELQWNHYYLRAVIGARMDNAEVLTTNLTRAVQLKAEVRQMAKEDVEFIKYFSNPAFEGAIR